jgi:hypothetical protein
MITKIISDNVSGLLTRHGVRAANIVNSDLNKTFMSRLLSGVNDFHISKLESLATALQQLEPGITASDLLDEKLLIRLNSECEKLTHDDIRLRMRDVIINLVDLDWIEVKEDVPLAVIGDYIYSAHIKKVLPENLVQTEIKKTAI